jgi:signal transduction histidine kinase
MKTTMPICRIAIFLGFLFLVPPLAECASDDQVVEIVVKKGGVLTVALSDVTLPPKQDSGHGDLHLPSGSYIKLTIKDTGHGMAPDIVKRIFDPYLLIGNR